MATALTRVILDRDPELRDTWTNLTPMGRIGEPEDLKGERQGSYLTHGVYFNWHITD